MIVTVEWAPQAGVSHYIARLSPMAPSFFTGSTSLQLMLLYNTEYNLSVVAITPCENAISFIRLHYGVHESMISYNSVHYNYYY